MNQTIGSIQRKPAQLQKGGVNSRQSVCWSHIPWHLGKRSSVFYSMNNAVYLFILFLIRFFFLAVMEKKKKLSPHVGRYKLVMHVLCLGFFFFFFCHVDCTVSHKIISMLTLLTTMDKGQNSLLHMNKPYLISSYPSYRRIVLTEVN